MNPDDIPTSVTQLVYTAPEIGGPATGIHSVSQNDMAKLLAHFWPAIEAAIREQVAREITSAADARLNAIDELDRKPSDQQRHQEWLDAAATARGVEVAW